jgi:hypothetical protein
MYTSSSDQYVEHEIDGSMSCKRNRLNKIKQGRQQKENVREQLYRERGREGGREGYLHQDDEYPTQEENQGKCRLQ